MKIYPGPGVFNVLPKSAWVFFGFSAQRNESDKRGILRSESESTGPGPVEDQGKEDSN